MGDNVNIILAIVMVSIFIIIIAFIIYGICGLWKESDSTTLTKSKKKRRK